MRLTTSLHPQKGKNGEEDRKLLDNVWGEVPEKQTTAIMGPSGAGKTSLLNILAGRAASRGRLSIESDVRLTLHDALGREVRVLAEGARPAGPQTIRTDPREVSVPRKVSHSSKVFSAPVNNLVMSTDAIPMNTSSESPSNPLPPFFIGYMLLSVLPPLATFPSPGL